MWADKINKRTLVVITVFFLILLILGGLTLVVNSSNNFSHFDNKKFTIDVPADFKASPDAIGFKFKSEEGEYFIITKNSANDVNSLEGIKKLSSENLSGESLPNIATENLQINGVPALHVTNSLENSAGISKTYYYFFVDGFVWKIEFGIKQKGQLETFIPKLVESFKPGNGKK